MGSGNPTVAAEETPNGEPVARSDNTPDRELLEKKPPDVAPRPHRITITLGLLPLLSPALALVALFFSFRSLEMSRRTLNLNAESQTIAQRAYVGSHLVLKEEDVFWKGKITAQVWDIDIELDNTGNTPANARLASVSPHTVEENDVKPVNLSTYPPENESAFISGKDKASFRVAQLYVAQTEIKNDCCLGFSDPIDVTFSYDDVFGKRHDGRIACRISFHNKKLTADGCESFAWDPPKGQESPVRPKPSSQP